MADNDISINLRLEDKDFAVTVKNSGRLLSELKRNLEGAADSSKKVENHFSSFTTQLRHTVMTLASVRFALMDIHDVFLQLPKNILKTTGEVERMTKLMEGLSKETDSVRKRAEAVSNTKFVFDLAQNAPFEVKALNDAFVKLKIAGLDPASGSLKILTDSIARFGGTSEHLHRASVAIQQMTGKGVISMEELRQQLGEAMPNAMQAMATGTGLSMGELVNKISKGSVEAKSALERMFAVLRVENDGAALKMMDTYVGQLEKLKTNWTLFANEVGQSGGFLTEVKNQLKNLNEMFGTDVAHKFAHDLSSALATTVSSVADLIGFVRKYSEEISLAGKAVLAIWGGTKIYSAMKIGNDLLDGVKKRYLENVSSAIEAERTQLAVTRANALQRAEAKVAQLEVERRTAQSTYAAMNVDYSAMMAKQRLLDIESNKFKSAAYANLLASQRVQLAEEMAATQANAIAHRGRAAALEAEIIAQRAHIAATQKQVASTIGLTVAKTALVGMRGALTGLFAALGGPIGVVTMLLTAGAFAWFEWGRSAEEAAKKAQESIKRVKDEVATLEDAANISKSISDIDTKIKQKKTNIESYSGADPTGFNAKKVEQFKREITELESKRAEAVEVLNKAIKQGNESAIKDTVRVVDQRVQNVIDAEKAGITKQFDADKEALETRLKSKEITQKQFDKKISEITRAAGVKTAEAEVQAYKVQKAVVQREIAKIESVAGFDKEGAIYQGYVRQFASLSKSQTASEGALSSAMKIGTESEYVAKDKGGKISRLQAAIQAAKGDLEAASIQLDDLSDGVITFDRLRDAALAEIQGDIKAGRFSDTDKNGDRVAPSLNDAEAEELATIRAKYDKRKAEISAAKTLNKLSKETSLNLAESASRFENGDNYEKSTTGLHKLQKQLEVTQATLVEGSEAWIKFKEDSKKLVSEQSIADLNNFTADLAKSKKELAAGLLPTERGRNEAKYQADIEEVKNGLKIRRDVIVADATLTEAMKNDRIAAAETAFGEWLALKAQDHARKMRTPLQQLAEEWGDITKQMEAASVGWANKTMDAIYELSTTGKTDFRGLTLSILSDIAKIQMKEGLGGMVTGAIGAGTSLLTKALTSGSKDRPYGPAQDGSNIDKGLPAFGVLIEKAGTGLKSMWNSITGATEATDKQTEATGSSIMTIFKEMFGITTKTTADSAATTAVTTLATAATAAAQALAQLAGSSGASSASSGASAVGSLLGLLGSMYGASGNEGAGQVVANTADTYSTPIADSFSGVTEVPFANGGIMTSLGSMSLKKYANGGIAKSPQLALFGEGKIPEAYVPLPDGRSIPVTMTGGGVVGGDNIVISISVTNVNGENKEEKKNSSGNEQSFYKGIADQVKVIVVDQLVAQQRPGGVLYRG